MTDELYPRAMIDGLYPRGEEPVRENHNYEGADRVYPFAMPNFPPVDLTDARPATPPEEFAERLMTDLAKKEVMDNTKLLTRACKNCGSNERAMVFAGKDWCSENCRKAMQPAKTSEEERNGHSLNPVRSQKTDYELHLERMVALLVLESTKSRGSFDKTRSLRYIANVTLSNVDAYDVDINVSKSKGGTRIVVTKRR